MSTTTTCTIQTLQDFSIKKDSDIRITVTAVADLSEDAPRDIVLPRLFQSWCDTTPVLHPAYGMIKETNEEYFRCTMNVPLPRHEKYVKVDFPYFASTWGHDARADRVWTVASWIRWMFDVDDRFDGGEFKDNLAGAAQLVDDILKITDNQPQPDAKFDDPLLAIYARMWQDISESASPTVAQRYAEGTKIVILEQLHEMDRTDANVVYTTESYLAMRRKTIGFRPCLALSEYLYDLDISEEILNHEVMEELVNIAVDLGSLHNDVLSFAKDQGEQFDHNIVTILQGSGTIQDGFDAVGVLMDDMFRRWDMAIKRLPSWGGEEDRQVERYIRCIKDIIVANLNWCFESERYFGKYNKIVRKTGIIPSQLQAAMIAKNLSKAAAAKN